jgi:predicted regulator of Ras-like GTPase activity (Roadblock/LC7/MglB family)
MDLEAPLADVKAVKGYLATGIMQYTGELLAGNSVTESINLSIVGATFNDIFRSAHEVCGKIGLDACREMVLYTPRGIVLMLCTGIKSKVHCHLITILSADGNQALAKMQMEKAGPVIMNLLG